jgi:hypothetical protein
MAIRKLRDIPREALVGKFICTPVRFTDQEFGWPALVEKTTASRLTALRLPRGDWDQATQEWQVRPTMSSPADTETKLDVLEGSGREERELYNLSSVRYVCDTAVEAIALYVQAVASRKAIESFRKTRVAELNAQALAGELSVPAYLPRLV